MTNPLFSVVVATGEASVGLRLAVALQPIPGIHVVSLADGEDLLAAVAAHDALVVIGDASLVADPGGRIEQLRAARAAVGFVIVTEQPSLSDAVLALRARVDEFFPGDASDEQLRDAVEAVAASVRRRLGPGAGRPVLLVGATLDAVLLGAGGAICMHADAGDRIVVATLDAGGEERRAALEETAAHLGASIVPLAASDDDLTAAVDALVREHRPAIVSTHPASDESAAQRLIHRAVVEAASDASRISCFQSTGSSIDFAPTLFVDIDGVLDRKVAALEAWGGDRKAAELVRSNAVYWSRFGTGRACEPFELLRDAVTTGSLARVDGASPAVSEHVPRT